MKVQSRSRTRKRIRTSIRKKLAGTPGRPRLAVFRSQCHIYAQIIDDEAGHTMCAASSLDQQLKPEHKYSPREYKLNDEVVQ